MSKTPAKKGSGGKPAPKPVAKKAAAKSAPKSPAKPAATKPAAKAVAKPAAKAAPAKAAPVKVAPVKAAAAKPAPEKAAPSRPAATKTAAPKAAEPKSSPSAKAVVPSAHAANAAPTMAERPAEPKIEPRPSPRPLPAAPIRPMPAAHTDQNRAAVKIDPKIANAWKSKSGRELTDEELLAMPDAEYMSDKQLEFFRARLEHLKNDLLSNAGETTEHLREDTSIVPDPADRATIEEEHALELRTRDRERKLLKKISQALTRIESGDYGYCDETGEPIGLARLLARPTATLSLEAQQRRELKQKMFGD